jgi:hypothetical protein
MTQRIEESFGWAKVTTRPRKTLYRRLARVGWLLTSLPPPTTSSAWQASHDVAMSGSCANTAGSEGHPRSGPIQRADRYNLRECSVDPLKIVSKLLRFSAHC